MPRMLPEDIRYWREVQGVTQKRLAELLGRHIMTVTAWESGRIPVPAWLYDWLEHLEFQVGAGRGVPHCPSKIAEIELTLYAKAKEAEKARQEREEARASRRALKAAREARKRIRALRKANHETLEQARKGLIRSNPSLLHYAEEPPAKPLHRPKVALRGSDDEKMRAMARQLRLRYGDIPPLTKK